MANKGPKEGAWQEPKAYDVGGRERNQLVYKDGRGKSVLSLIIEPETTGTDEPGEVRGWVRREVCLLDSEGGLKPEILGSDKELAQFLEDNNIPVHPDIEQIRRRVAALSGNFAKKEKGKARARNLIQEMKEGGMEVMRV